MSSINSISSGASFLGKHAAQVTPTSPQPQQSVLATIQKEATESLDTTRQEAAKGDPVAIRKLAKLEELKQARQGGHAKHASNATPKSVRGIDDAGTGVSQTQGPSATEPTRILQANQGDQPEGSASLISSGAIDTQG